MTTAKQLSPEFNKSLNKSSSSKHKITEEDAEKLQVRRKLEDIALMRELGIDEPLQLMAFKI